jgi:pimeloyl-ACP methyl ester carboxylesterase
MGGQFATKSLIYDGLSPYCDNITGYIVENCGHYIPEESPDSIIEAILKTFN